MVHVSETCESTAPHLLTHVHTTAATVHEVQCTIPIQQALMDKGVLPREHFVDAAYVSAELLVQSRDEQGITLRGPTRPSQGWQGQVAGGLHDRALHGGLGAAAGVLSPGEVGRQLARAREAGRESLHRRSLPPAGLSRLSRTPVMHAGPAAGLPAAAAAPSPV
jgi:hypothetical protein